MRRLDLLPTTPAHEWDEREEERRDIEVGGVEDRDDGDRDEVVHDGEGEQEGAQARGQVGADDGEHGEREGDVGRRRDGPAAVGVRVRSQHRDDPEEDQRRHEDPAEGCGHGDRGPRDGLELAHDELALELQPCDEEEDREQAVSGPVPHGELEVSPLETDLRVAQTFVEVAQRGVGEDQRHDGGEEQDAAADGLGAEGVGDELGLGPGRPAEDRGAHRADGLGGVGDGVLRRHVRLVGRHACLLVGGPAARAHEGRHGAAIP